MGDNFINGILKNIYSNLVKNYIWSIESDDKIIKNIEILSDTINNNYTLTNNNIINYVNNYPIVFAKTVANMNVNLEYTQNNLTIDGYVLIDGDILLLAGQTNKIENG